MRIVGVSISTRAHLVGGMEDHLHTLMSGLARLGHDVTVLTSRHPDGHAHVVEDGVEWRYLDAPLDFFSEGWRTELLAAMRELTTAGVDVVHSQSSSALPLLRAGAGVPIVLSLHGNFVSIVGAAATSVAHHPTPIRVVRETRGVAHVARRHFRARNWRAFRPCHAIVPSRSQVRPSIVAHCLRPSKVHVVGNAIDTDVFRPRARAELRHELGLRDDAPLIAVVGRLDRKKGTDVALEGIARSACGESSVVVVGEGPARRALESMAAARGLDGRVRFTGRVDEEQVARFLAASDLFLFPSRLAEAGPLVVAQAMACGTPLVASNVGAVPEMLGADGVAGVLVRPGSASAIADAIDRLLPDPGLLARMGAAARDRALERFRIERMVTETAAVYEIAMRNAT